ncbi:MAG TPA: ABC transporter permease [Longimicrobiaceae bacterium]|nr:ABC transporter permease [Longimicrobiaceae bacterium]
MRETPAWRRYLRLGASDPAADVRDELDFHLAMRVDDLVRAGLPEAEARERARREFGDVAEIRREMERIGLRGRRRRSRTRGWESLRQDLRLAVRTLRGSPGFTAVAALTLAAGIGAGTAMFSVVDGVLLRDLPLPEPERVAVLWTEAPARDSDHLPVTYRELTDFGGRTRAFRSVAGVAYHGAGEFVLRDAGRPFTVSGTWVTGGFFPVLGVAPLHGRTLLPSDDAPGAARAMVIGHALWRRRFGGDPAAVGRTLEWNGKRFTVVGVLPPGFDYPRGAEFWIPVLPDFPGTLEEGAEPSEVMVFDLVGRLRPGATVLDAREDYAAFLRAGDPQRPPALRGTRPVVTPLPELVAGDARATIWTVAAAVGLLLLVACVNVANLLLVRGSARAQELAVRAALGAGRGRLVRQLLTESGVLALLGGVLGVAFAWAAVRALVALAPPELPRREMIGVDARVLAFALAATAAAALLAGLFPALLAARGDPGGWLRGGRRTGSAGPGVQALRHGLVVGQVGLAILVVAGAGLLVRSLATLQGVEMGFDTERLLVVQTALPPELLPERAQQVALQEAMVERVAALPGVAAAASLPSRPFSGRGGWSAMYSGEGQAPGEQSTNPWVSFEVVGPGYFRTLEVPLRRGRVFDERDREDAPRVAVVSEAVARHTWPGEDPVGRRIKLGPHDAPGEWHTVVGVVGETRYRELTEPQPSLYLPVRQFPGPVPMSLAVRTRADPAGVLPQLRRALREVHPELAVVGGGPMRELLAAPLARPRFGTLLLGAFAAVTLLLAAVGIYGVMAAAVRQRTREIGIRLALGATAGEVRGAVLRQGMRLALLGCAVGIAGALLGTRALRSLLYGVSPTDPATFAAVAGLILASAALACWLPARRAARVDPVNALRAE